MSITTTSFGFIPTNIPGCRLWFDGADPAGNGVIPANGASIATWIDKSGNGQNLSGIGSSTAGTFAGLRIVNFNSSYFQNGSFTQSGPLTIILIGKMNSLGSDWQTFSDNVGGLRPYVGMQAGSPPLRTAFRFGGTATTNVEIWTLTFSASDNTVFNVNGSDVRGAATGYGGIGFTNGIRLGLAANATAYLVGWIGEYIVYNTDLSISQYQQLESYLSQKWRITTSLPGGHPGLTSTVYRSTYLRNTGVKRNIATMTPFFTGFTPRQIPGLGLWLDGADSSSITTVTGVSQWNDKSGNGYNLTQGSTGSQPTRTGNLLNFVSNYNMNIPQAAVNNASTWSMFFLVNPIASVNWFMAKQRDGVNSYNIFSTTQTGGPGPNAYFTGSTNFLYVRMFNAGTLAASAAALTMSQLQLLAFIYDGTSMFIYINGNLSSTTVGSFAIQNDTSATNFLLGQWFGNGTNYNSSGNFQLGELVYFNTFLAATQRQQIESYLAQKWGLVSSLPGGHLNVTQPAGARTALSLVNSKFTVTPRLYSPIVATVGNFTSIVGGAAGGGLWMTAVTPNGDIYTKSYNPAVYRLSGATYSNPFSCDNWGQGLTTDGSFVYGTDTNSAQIFRFNPATSTRNLMINSIASPCGLAADGIGNIYISQQIWQNPNNTIYRYNIAANTTTMLYNVSLSTYYFAGMAPDGLGNVYLSDYVTNRIYRLNSSNVLTVLAGSGTAGFADGTGTSASFNISMYINFSNNLCYDGNGNLYLAETNNNRIRKIVIATAVVTTIAGTGVSGTVDGPGLSARLASPLGISFANGFLYWCEDKVVRRLTL